MALHEARVSKSTESYLVTENYRSYRITRCCETIETPTFSLLFVELAVARVFTLLNLCPNVHARLHLLTEKLVGRKKREEMVEE
ncbi:hypothetical protein YC2023_111326 [Brassica napus]